MPLTYLPVGHAAMEQIGHAIRPKSQSPWVYVTGAATLSTQNRQENVKIMMHYCLPLSYYITYGGQFENQQRAAARLDLVVPVSIALIFVMLFNTFRSLGQAGLIILKIPFAMIGGVVALYLSGLYLSVPASVGFITLFGVAVLYGVVMVSYFNQRRETGQTVLQAVQEDAERRLRPVLIQHSLPPGTYATVVCNWPRL